MAAKMRARTVLSALSLTAVLAAGRATPALAQEGPLAVARDLYASARYDEALAMLNGVRQQESANPVNLRSIEQYRSLCLLALGRGTEAEAAIAVVVASDPMYQPTETEASPRVRTAFSEVRQRQLARHRADTIRVREVRIRPQGLSVCGTAVPRTAAAHRRPGYGRPPWRSAPARQRLRRLEHGRCRAATARAGQAGAEARRGGGGAGDADRARSAESVLDGRRRGGAADADPPGRAACARADRNQTRERGILEIVIDEQGRVINATIRVSLHPIYDAQILVAARDWKYSPALANGRPVKFRKTIQITLSKR